MANLNESDLWEAGIYQLEEDDPVLGGPTGIDNLAPRQLASRTRYQRLRNITPWDATLTYPANVAYVSYAGTTWKSVGESLNVAPGADAAKWVRWAFTAAELNAALGDAVTAHEAKANPHPQYATDADLAAHVADANPHPQYATDADLAAHVAAADPHAQYIMAAGDAMTGPLTLVDAGQFDNSAKAASTAHVQRALGNYSGTRDIAITGGTNLTAADMGRYISVSAAGVNLTLPAGNAIAAGATFVLGPSQRCVITRSGADGIMTPAGSVVTSMALFSPAIVTWRGDIWHVLELPMGGDADAGEVFYTARATPPAGSIKANGAAVSRTTYSRLYTAIGTTFGVGDGATTFNVPNARGLVLRGFDDGRGIDTGRVLGTEQEGTWLRTMAQEWTGADGVAGGPYAFGNPFANADASISNSGGPGGTVPAGAKGAAGGAWQAAASDNFMLATAAVDATVANTWIRFRMSNLALMACIKY
ncbi:Phage Tail Collar Domain [Variovorax sp. YR752]|uniref:phage tail protein n=1 Tax=Variovorax sp. YR752 TaxID=1884383 RepID=UPI000BC433DC|nr:phage tail protein [Variovorax sp. YR752]SOD27661.1 Phage Tail Collar Domain [Variovorax sp. YR752]